MIISAEIINQPYSGEYEERIYDIFSPWNSQYWTWVKFVNDDYTEWCGEFRGKASSVALSDIHGTILVITSDYMYLLDNKNGDLLEYKDQPQYINLTVSPKGDYIVADCYNIELIDSTLSKKKTLHSPIQMDMIKFHGWNNNKLLISCDKFTNWDKHFELELDGDTYQITIIKTRKGQKNK